MIVRMLKTYVAARSDDKDRLLLALRELGAVHLTPVDPAAAVAHEQTRSRMDHLSQAIGVLMPLEPAGQRPTVSPLAAAEEALAIQRRSAERRVRLSTLHRQLVRQAVWGDMRIGDVEDIRRAGLTVRFFSVPAADAADIKADLVCFVGGSGEKRQIVAVASRGNAVELPESAEELEIPARDCPSIRAEAADIDAQLRQDAERMGQLAFLVDQMEAARAELAGEARYTVAERGAVADEHLFAVQGWIPAERGETLADELAAAGVEAAVETAEPSDEETPPTLIRYSRWVKPIKALFDILGTLPGYRELDLSPFFMVALPLFAAMLIGDAGYGLIFMLPALLMYRKMSAKVGSVGTNLLIVMGFATFIWGVLTANYFGLTPASMAAAAGVATVADLNGVGGVWASLGRGMLAVGALWRSDAEAGRVLIIKISFIFGCIHLTLAHLKQFFAMLPSQKAISELGWCVVLWAMLGIIWLLFFKTVAVPINTILIALAVGASMAIGFTAPGKSIGKRIGIGIASSILPLLGTFSDTMSYIRLMAVGLASYYIAAAFNNLGADLAKAITWYAVVPIVVIVFGHILNIALAVIAIFAHGVRLNMLEFSSNAGVQWAGYAYEPFAGRQLKEN